MNAVFNKFANGDSLFGYDSFITIGKTIVSIQGKGATSLYLGMQVILLGDSKGYVPGGRTNGEVAVISGFIEPFKDGESDHIILLNGGGMVKPSNIAFK